MDCKNCVCIAQRTQMHDRTHIDEKAQELLLTIDAFHRIRISSFFSKFKAFQSSSIMPRSTVQISNILISTDLFNWISWGNEKRVKLPLHISYFFQRAKCALFRFRVKVKALRSREDRDLRLAGECIFMLVKSEKTADDVMLALGWLALSCERWTGFQWFRKEAEKRQWMSQKVQDNTRASACMVEGDLRTSWSVSLRPQFSMKGKCLSIHQNCWFYMPLIIIISLFST